MTATTYSINDIKARMRASGSHWWNPDTMCSFGTVIESHVYNGPGGVYFVTSEAYDGEASRKATVRQYDPETNEVETVGDFNALDVHVAKMQARSLAAGTGSVKEVITETGRLAKETDAEFLAHLLTNHAGMTCNTAQARHLINVATTLQVVAEEMCNGPEDAHLRPAGDRAYYEAWEKRVEHRQELAVNRAKKLAREVGATAVITGGDPRGAALKLVAPNGWTNDFGKEGVCIPINRKD